MSQSIDVASLFPVSAIRCRRIVRDTEKSIGDLQLNGETASQLGTDNVGVLAAKCPPTGGLIDKFRKLATSGLHGQIVIALSTVTLMGEYYEAIGPRERTRNRPDWWTEGCVTFTTPEKLRLISPSALNGQPVLAVILVDPLCIVHQARGGSQSAYRFNDRPKHIVSFRAAHESGSWRPPFFLFTEQPAKSLNSNQMLGPYSLEAWWFADGSGIRMGTPPIIESPLPEASFRQEQCPGSQA
jgi:hypothetical protein